MEYLNSLPSHTIFIGKNLTPFSFLQEHRYDITSMTSFSKDSFDKLIQGTQKITKEFF